jgi:cytochrome c-type biogenesis protein CcmH
MLQGLPDTNGAAGAIRARMAALIGAAEPSGQNAMIAGMVAQLDAKLDADGSDRVGWIKLMRSYQVLGQRANAEDALARARKALASSPEGLAAINAAAQELGLGN